MEKTEPALVPEWLRSTANVSSGGSSSHHFSSSFSHSDSQTRNRNLKSKSDVDTICSPFLDRSSSANSRRGSSNQSAKHAYSSFNKNHRDKGRDRDKDRVSYVDPWDSDSSDPLGSILTCREKDRLRRSQSMVLREQSELLPQRVSLGLKNGGKSNQNSGNSILPGSTMGNSFQKIVFQKDFPSLGSEERHGDPDLVRVSSPGLSTAIQSLPVGSSVLIGGEGWTSALAEVPNVIEKTVIGLSSPQTGAANTGTPSGTSCFNMAEALVQAPPRTHTPPQLSVKTQRLEELAIKQSRQLIPVIPSMPKGYVLNSSDKSKIKPASRTSEIGHTVFRSAAQQLSTSLNSSQSHRSGQIKPDSPKKLLVLKPSWENGVSPVPKDGANPTNDNGNGRAAGNQLTVVPSAPLGSTNSPKECKPALSNMIPGLTSEKRPSLSQTQSRNDFFNILKRKNSVNASADPPNPSEKAERSKGFVSEPCSPQTVVVNGDEVTDKNDSGQTIQRYSQAGDKNMSFEAVVYSDAEEYAFLRSLGWEEHGGEDEGLTEEEINTFYEQCKELRPSLKLNEGMLPKLSGMQETTEGVASSDSESDV